MNISPNPSTFTLNGNGYRSKYTVDAMKMSPAPGGMSWLLDSEPEANNQQQQSPGALLSTQQSSKASTASLLSNSSHNGGYYTMHHVPSTERVSSMRRISSRASTESLRNSMKMAPSIPELAHLQSQPSGLSSEQPLDVLSQAINSCTSSIFGLYGLEVWKFDENGLTSIQIQSPNVVDIRRQSSGIFIKRVTQEADYQSPNFNSASRDAFERLTDTTRLDHLSQKSTDPGVGIAGALWSEATTSKTLAAVQHGVAAVKHGVESISETLHRRVGLLAGLHPVNSHHDNEHAKSVLWREIDTLAEDPDQPYDERLQTFARAGFNLAAGIPFDIQGFRGMVVFYANPHADLRKLQDSANNQLILLAAQFIGSAAAIQNPIKTATILRKRRPIMNWRILKAKIMAVIRFQRPIHRKRRGRSNSYGSPTMRRVDSFKIGLKKAASFAMDREASFKLLSEATVKLKRDIKKSATDLQYASKAKGMRWWQKVHGGHASLPPAFNAVQCFWTFTGVYTTHVILSSLDYFIQSKSDGAYQLLLGPLGALTTLQYNLTAAPASQPRNAFFAQVLALSVCYILHRVEDLDKWHRCALAPAIVTTITARLGIIHPPAGATSVVFSYAEYQVEDMFIFLVGVSIAIFTAVVINNLSDKRQYPSTQWAIFNYYFDSR